MSSASFEQARNSEDVMDESDMGVSGVRIRRVEELEVRWLRMRRPLTKVGERLALDARRRCWACGDPFRERDRMVIVSTNGGCVFLHDHCVYQATDGALTGDTIHGLYVPEG